MHDEPIPGVPRTTPRQLERLVLELLLDPASHGPWTAQELGLELGDEIAAVDALARLHAAGLVHLCMQLVFPTRAAASFAQLADAM